jgi:3-oxoacyl-[acyl-carrier protein] reductase
MSEMCHNARFTVNKISGSPAMIDLTGKTALVTGGSRGIGKEICLMLARAGANVALGFRNNESAAQAVVEKIHSTGKHAIAVAGDVSKRETFERFFGETRDAFGRIHIAVGNAGIWERGAIDEMTDEQWQETIDTNLKSAYYICQFAALEMKPHKSGKIILVSSTAGQRGEPFYSHYAAAKGGIISLTKSLAAELGPEGIRVNCVAPGWVDTDMCTEAFDNPRFRKAVVRSIPLRRIPGADQIAGAVLFLASDLANHVTGEILNVNGGAVLCG